MLSTDDWVTLGAASLAAVIVAVGWYVTRKFESDRRREDARIQVIQDAFVALASAANRKPEDMSPDLVRGMETAVTRIELLGTEREREAALLFCDSYQEIHPDGLQRGDLDPLLIVLRKSLREELGLSTARGPVRWFRPNGGAQ